MVQSPNRVADYVVFDVDVLGPPAESVLVLRHSDRNPAIPHHRHRIVWLRSGDELLDLLKNHQLVDDL